jgi:hypothetical protein
MLQKARLGIERSSVFAEILVADNGADKSMQRSSNVQYPCLMVEPNVVSWGLQS